jgi:hypothetical protein
MIVTVATDRIMIIPIVQIINQPGFPINALNVIPLTPTGIQLFTVHTMLYTSPFTAANIKENGIRAMNATIILQISK